MHGGTDLGFVARATAGGGKEREAGGSFPVFLGLLCRPRNLHLENVKRAEACKLAFAGASQGACCALPGGVFLAQ